METTTTPTTTTSESTLALPPALPRMMRTLVSHPPTMVDELLLREGVDLKQTPSNWLMYNKNNKYRGDLNGNNGWPHLVEDATSPQLYLHDLVMGSNVSSSPPDFVSDSAVLGKLLTWQLSERPVSVVVHRVGQTLVLEGMMPGFTDSPTTAATNGPVLIGGLHVRQHRASTAPTSVEEQTRLRRAAASEITSERLKKKNETRQRDNVLLSKLQFRAMASMQANNDNNNHTQQQGTEENTLPRAPLSIHEIRHRNFSCLVASNLFVCQQQNCAFSLYLQNQDLVPPSRASVMRLFVANMVAGVPHLAHLRHTNGIVTSVDMMRTSQIPVRIPSRSNNNEDDEDDNDTKKDKDFAELSKNATALLTFLQTNCQPDVSSFWLFKSRGDDVARLWRLDPSNDNTLDMATRDRMLYSLAMLCVRAATGHAREMELLTKSVDLLDGAASVGCPARVVLRLAIRERLVDLALTQNTPEHAIMHLGHAHAIRQHHLNGEIGNDIWTRFESKTAITMQKLLERISAKPSMLGPNCKSTRNACLQALSSLGPLIPMFESLHLGNEFYGALLGNTLSGIAQFGANDFDDMVLLERTFGGIESQQYRDLMLNVIKPVATKTCQAAYCWIRALEWYGGDGGPVQKQTRPLATARNGLASLLLNDCLAFTTARDMFHKARVEFESIRDMGNVVLVYLNLSHSRRIEVAMMNKQILWNEDMHELLMMARQDLNDAKKTLATAGGTNITDEHRMHLMRLIRADIVKTELLWGTMLEKMAKANGSIVDEVAKHFESALEHDPQSCSVHFFLGSHLARVAKKRLLVGGTGGMVAARHLMKAIGSTTPSHADERVHASVELASLHVMEKEYVKAMDVLLRKDLMVDDEMWKNILKPALMDTIAMMMTTSHHHTHKLTRVQRLKNVLSEDKMASDVILGKARKEWFGS